MPSTGRTNGLISLRFFGCSMVRLERLSTISRSFSNRGSTRSGTLTRCSIQNKKHNTPEHSLSCITWNREGCPLRACECYFSVCEKRTWNGIQRKSDPFETARCERSRSQSGADGTSPCKASALPMAVRPPGRVARGCCQKFFCSAIPPQAPCSFHKIVNNFFER